MRRFHRWFGLGSTVVVLLAVITGLLWAYAPHLYWQGGYMEKKRPAPAVRLDEVTFTPQQAIAIARESLGAEAAILAVALRSDLGQPVFEISGQNAGQERTVLVDPEMQRIVSPLSEEIATSIAQQYVADGVAVQSIELLPAWKHRSGKMHEQVYHVRFTAPRNPEILLSATTGRILEEQDDVRRFHFWVMRLHQLSFFGTKKTLTIIPGAAILILIVTGVALSRRRKAVPVQLSGSKSGQRQIAATSDCH